MTKYGTDISQESVKQILSRLTNQIWKLIPMKENEENWEKQLDTMTIEIAGLNELFPSSNLYFSALIKLEGLRKTSDEISFAIFRKTVFEIINLLQGLKNEL